MPKILGLYEWRFIDPATIVDGKDERGLKVIELYGPGHPTGPAAPSAFAQHFGRWPEALDKFAAKQADYAATLRLAAEGLVDLERADRADAATRSGARTYLAKILIQLTTEGAS